MPSTEEVLERIDFVLKENRRTEWCYIILTVALFVCGIAAFIMAMVSGNYLWSTPSVVTTGLLTLPLKEIRNLREKNIALATAPMLITQLPPRQAAEEIQKLLKTLYGGK